jgi:hypothetical protein
VQVEFTRLSELTEDEFGPELAEDGELSDEDGRAEG